MACELTGNTNWSSLIALAAANAANDNYEEAAELASQAAELALGDKRKLCLEIAAKYEAREIAKWEWK